MPRIAAIHTLPENEDSLPDIAFGACRLAALAVSEVGTTKDETISLTPPRAQLLLRRSTDLDARCSALGSSFLPLHGAKIKTQITSTKKEDEILS